MKKTVFFLLLLCILGKGIGQNYGQEKNLEEWETAIPVLHQVYLDNVFDTSTPISVKQMEIKIANYDFKKSTVFDKTEAYRVTFSHNKGNAVVVYGPKGTILSSHEIYNGIHIPEKIKKNVLRQFPEWAISQTRYRVSYQREGITKRLFKVNLVQGNSKKMVNFDVQGLRLN